MNTPLISEICTTDIKSVSITATLSEALQKMYESEHRQIIVTNGKKYYLLSIYDILRLKHKYLDESVPLSSLSLSRIPAIYKDMRMIEALEYLSNDFEQIVVLNNDGSLHGIITQSDILSNIDPETMMERYRLIDLLKIKKRDRWVNKEMSTNEILHIMESNNHDAVIIVEARKPIGIFTTKDILRLLKKDVDFSQPIERYMVTPVVTIPQNVTLRKSLEIVQNKNFKRIVTIDDAGNLVGSISQKELVSIAYTKWIRMINSYQTELQKTNETLERKSRKYEKIAAIDPLTGLYNRMKFFELFISEYTVMMQRENALSILLIDLDYFKQINDRYGHNMGDKVLKQVANLLLKELRSVDIICRWGGEEFVVLLPAVSKMNAVRIAEKIRHAIEVLQLHDIPSITASIGVSEVKRGDTLHDVIERADKALYQAKMSGRNCIEMVS